VDPEQSAWSEIRSEAERFRRIRGKALGGGGERDERGLAIYNYKKSVLLGNSEEAMRWWQEYVHLSKSIGMNPWKGAHASIRAWSPTYPMKGYELEEFESKLPEEMKRKLVKARAYYERLKDTPLPRKEETERGRAPALGR
jgi:hypothetical protein